MKPRDRVIQSLNRQKPDRCPMQISFTPEFAQRLRENMRLSGHSAHNPHGGGNTYELERALGQDLLLTSVGWANSYYANDLYAGGADSYTDEWGIGWKNSPYETRFGNRLLYRHRRPPASRPPRTRRIPPARPASTGALSRIRKSDRHP